MNTENETFPVDYMAGSKLVTSADVALEAEPSTINPASPVPAKARAKMTKAERDKALERILQLLTYGCTTVVVRQITGLEEKQVGILIARHIAAGGAIESSPRRVVQPARVVVNGLNNRHKIDPNHFAVYDIAVGKRDSIEFAIKSADAILLAAQAEVATAIPEPVLLPNE